MYVYQEQNQIRVPDVTVAVSASKQDLRIFNPIK